MDRLGTLTKLASYSRSVFTAFAFKPLTRKYFRSPIDAKAIFFITPFHNTTKNWHTKQFLSTIYALLD